ncbi:hypothetical protein MSAN_00665600 [Mycena sanguinolenta]|uniref:Uncharacterized protein n=1 Tax=Mycena sanguinolenta TaxID=230812 RepID=A0A8H6Z435_9AGAR|nr:hypothetical protein MSAN_00665600 [Mycena sanguinolenta]
MLDSGTIYLSLRSPFLWHAIAIALSLIPIIDLRYGAIAVAIAYLGLYAVHRMRPSSRLEQLDDAIKIAAELLSRAISQACSRNIFKVDEIRRELLEARLLVSQIQSDFLEAHDASWMNYLQSMRAIWQKLNQCEHQVLTMFTYLAHH